MRLYMTELTVSDLATSVGWWSELLGRDPTLHDLAGEFALFELPGGRLALKQGTTPDRGVIHLEVDVLPERDVKVSDEGYRRVKLFDPDGNVAVLFEWESSAHAESVG